jgi:predicted nucleic acid-binding Zn ribbon protein
VRRSAEAKCGRSRSAPRSLQRAAICGGISQRAQVAAEREGRPHRGRERKVVKVEHRRVRDSVRAAGNDLAERVEVRRQVLEDGLEEFGLDVLRRVETEAVYAEVGELAQTVADDGADGGRFGAEVAEVVVQPADDRRVVVGPAARVKIRRLELRELLAQEAASVAHLP